MQATNLKNFRFLVAREAGHTQIVTMRAATRAQAMAAVCQSNPGASVERYSADLASSLGATKAERKWAGTRYEHGSIYDPETWIDGDIIIDRRGDRSLVTGPMLDHGHVPMLHLAPGKKYDMEAFSLHVLALTNTYGYRLEGQAVGDVAVFEGKAMNDPAFDSALDIEALVIGA